MMTAVALKLKKLNLATLMPAQQDHHPLTTAQ
jgi:hypothetical protein